MKLFFDLSKPAVGMEYEVSQKGVCLLAAMIDILEMLNRTGQSFREFVFERDAADILDDLEEVRWVMKTPLNAVLPATARDIWQRFCVVWADTSMYASRKQGIGISKLKEEKRRVDQMRIHIRFFSFIKFETGLDDIEIQVDDGSTVEDLIKQLDQIYGDSLIRFIQPTDRNKMIALFVRDNKILRSSEALFNGDRLKIMPSVGGG